MKKSNVKKVVTMTAILVMCLNTTPIFAESNNVRVIHDNEVVMPMNVAITLTSNNLELGSAGKLTCEGRTDVQSGYTAGVTMELQQYDAGWRTIKTWSNSTLRSVALEETHYVSSGHSYRLKLTHTAYNSSGTLVETITKYSDVVYY